tara:strand:- start:6486 stop:7232 length:747 start_codon:yes stop_codon:yes gene_type:complete
MKILQATLLIFVLNFTVNGQEASHVSNILKVSLTDFAVGQYTLGYERIMGPDWSINATISGVGYQEASQNYSVGHYYDEWGQWFSMQGEVEAQVEGVAMSFGLRKYSAAHEIRSHGFYGGVFTQFRRCTTEFSEEFEAFEPFSELYGLAYPHSVNHAATISSVGIGVELGYHWLAANGLSLDVFAGPMFRSMSRERVFESLPMTEEDALDGLENRLNNQYFLSPQFSDLYMGRTGSWFRAGITLGLKL